MKVGDFVQLLDIEGKPLKNFYGIVIESEASWAKVHWQSGGFNGFGGGSKGGSTTWAHVRLKVLSNADR